MNPWDVLAWSASIGLTIIIGVIVIALIVSAVKVLTNHLKKSQ